MRDWVRVHRLEYPFPVIYLCHALWGASFAATTPADLIKIQTIIAVVANLIPLVAQNLLNGALDVEADSRTPGKGGIATATLNLGRTKVITVAFAEMAVALGLASLVNVVCFTAVALGVLIELAYNLEPVRLKRRGVLNPIFLGIHFSLLPCIGTYAALRNDFPIVIFGGITLLLIARALWWSVPDLRADEASGDRPLAVRHGARTAWLTACAITAAGLLAIGAGLWWRHGPAWAIGVTLVCSMFLVDKLVVLRGLSDTRLPHEKRLRRVSLSFVLVADVTLVLTPLIAG
ncbi:UbiA family prenyltransferase [Lentzea sp. NPDC005914]|uniref:UbiA prenyltransferase family protein n=1 Tax=Lentzea sp. NPDC005914 TaxID=3154572 RepID=UPI00340FC8CC